MAFDDRLTFLLIGMFIGFVVGYLTRLIRELRSVKEELDEVDEIVKHLDIRKNNEHGFMKISLIHIMAVLLVVLSAYAAIVSQKASDNIRTSVDRNEIATYCNLNITSRALNSLNQRSTYTLKQTQSNVDLQTDFSTFINILLHQPPYKETKRRHAAEVYQKSLNHFVAVASKSVDKISDNPFPTVAQLVTCIQKGEVPGNNLSLYLEKMKTEGDSNGAK